MGRQAWEESEERFGAYVGGLTRVIGHADRAAPLKGYCTGLLAAEGRRSVEPMAAVTAPAGVSRSTRSFCISSPTPHGRRDRVGQGAGDGVAGDRAARPIEAWIIDTRRSPSRQALGRRAPSVLRPARQAGQLSGGGDAVDRQPSCQPADRLSLYLPKNDEDAARRKKARIPEEITFKTKPQIALIRSEQRARRECARRRADDAAYGCHSALRHA